MYIDNNKFNGAGGMEVSLVSLECDSVENIIMLMCVIKTYVLIKIS